jgi:hypothetical protein
VKEHLIVHQRPDRASFSFATGPTGFAADPTTPGALRPSGALSGAAQIAAPEVLDHNGVPLGVARPSLASAAGTVSVAVDPTWLAGLTAADYPVDIDPTIAMGGGSTCYKSDGTTVGPCQVRTGNTMETPNKFWRTSTYFDYSGLLGAHVWAAQIDLGNLQAGTANGYTISLYQTAAFSFGGNGAFLNGPVSGTTAYTFYSDRYGKGADSRLAAMYDYYTWNRIAGEQVFFAGNETPGVYTYKQLNNFTLTLTYNYPPGMATPAAPGSSGHSVAPTLTVNPVAESDGDPIYYWYRLCTGADAESGSCPVDTGWLQNASSFTVPSALLYNTAYYWHVYTYDGLDQTNPNWVSSYHTVNNPPATPNPQAGGPSGTTALPAVVTTTTPTLSVPAVTDPDAGDTVKYQFQIASTRLTQAS